MEPIKAVLDLFLHLDKHLANVTQTYGAWTYGILFLIIFAETGFVVTPFLPGDSLLFAAGAISAIPGSGLNIGLLLVLLFVAAVLGDTVNYWIGKSLGARPLAGGRSRLLKKDHLDRTHAFFEKHGGKTIILARFVPIVRTFAPFVAGMGSMRYGQFLLYNIVGGAIWVGLCAGAGHLFGNIPVVRKNFEFVVLAIVLLSVLPLLIELLQHRAAARRETVSPKVP